MFGFRNGADTLARKKAERQVIVARHNAILDTERRVPAPDPLPSKKKIGFGKRTLYPL